MTKGLRVSTPQALRSTRTTIRYLSPNSKGYTMARQNQEFSAKGGDGKTADLPGKPRIPASPVISKAPYLASASARCGNCGTSQALSGRPGTSIDKFTCRSCKSVNKANGDLGFSFFGQN